jgi:hypothetical protein
MTKIHNIDEEIKARKLAGEKPFDTPGWEKKIDITKIADIGSDGNLYVHTDYIKSLLSHQEQEITDYWIKKVGTNTEAYLKGKKDGKQEVKKEIINKIDRVYKKEGGIRNWLDLKQLLK